MNVNATWKNKEPTALQQFLYTEIIRFSDNDDYTTYT